MNPAHNEDWLDRLSHSFTVGDGCWEWTGCRYGTGYGSFWRDGRNQGAHRVVYELMVGPIPDGLQIDHLCRNRGCVRPSHLEPVTQAENLRRGLWGANVAERMARTHCPQGHEYSPENTLPQGKNGRRCKTCHYADIRNRRARRRAAGEDRAPCAECGRTLTVAAYGLCGRCYQRRRASIVWAVAP